MSDKQAALEAIRRLPDEVSFREIREGEAQEDQGKVIPLEQVEKNLQS